MEGLKESLERVSSNAMRRTDRAIMARTSQPPRFVTPMQPYCFMKCFSNRCLDRSAPSSVSITDFALDTGS